MALPNESSASDPIISVRNLSAGYGDKPIFSNVSFDIYPGEIFAVMGRSGCGKTTLFKTLVGLLEPMSGEVFIDGEKVLSVSHGTATRLLRKIGVLFQSNALFSSMTLAENVAFPIRQYTTLPETTIGRLVLLKLSEVGLAGCEKLLPSELSGGMQKRAALARAMALDPKILFFDEPSAGLDPVTSRELDHTIEKINRTLGTTIVLVTHELQSVFAIARRVIMLDGAGKGIVAEGTPAELRERHDDPRVRDFFNPARSEADSGTENSVRV
jgi:phospholipid/cholesterol/gamma-HCH transport system ATP-binding protein